MTEWLTDWMIEWMTLVCETICWHSWLISQSNFQFPSTTPSNTDTPQRALTTNFSSLVTDSAFGAVYCTLLYFLFLLWAHCGAYVYVIWLVRRVGCACLLQWRNSAWFDVYGVWANANIGRHTLATLVGRHFSVNHQKCVNQYLEFAISLYNFTSN